jgi:hypothetical protein
MKNIIRNFSKTAASEECKKACPYECDSIEYRMSTYRLFYPTEFYASVLNEYFKTQGFNTTNDNIEKSVAKVNIYYKSMEYLTTQQIVSVSDEDFFLKYWWYTWFIHWYKYFKSF